MNKLDVFLQKSVFYSLIRKRIIESVVLNYYTEYTKLFAHKTVLEIGCGNGYGAKVIKKYFSPQKIVATDLDQGLINFAKESVKDPVIFFELADCSNLKYKNGTFDAIFDFGVIHHIPNWKDSLKELHRVLKPKGKIFIYDVPIESFSSIWGRIIKIFTLHPYKFMYRKDEFRDYLKELGFKILKDRECKTSLVYFIIVAEK